MLSKNELSLIYKKYISILKENNISTKKYVDILKENQASIDDIYIDYDWICFEENGSCIPYIIIHNEYYDYIIKERNDIVFEKNVILKTNCFMKFFTTILKDIQKKSMFQKDTKSFRY